MPCALARARAYALVVLLLVHVAPLTCIRHVWSSVLATHTGKTVFLNNSQHNVSSASARSAHRRRQGQLKATAFTEIEKQNQTEVKQGKDQEMVKQRKDKKVSRMRLRDEETKQDSSHMNDQKDLAQRSGTSNRTHQEILKTNRTRMDRDEIQMSPNGMSPKAMAYWASNRSPVCCICTQTSLGLCNKDNARPTWNIISTSNKKGSLCHIIPLLDSKEWTQKDQWEITYPRDVDHKYQDTSYGCTPGDDSEIEFHSIIWETANCDLTKFNSNQPSTEPQKEEALKVCRAVVEGVPGLVGEGVEVVKEVVEDIVKQHPINAA